MSNRCQQEQSFLSVYFSHFVHPDQTIQVLVLDNRRVRFGALAVLVPAVGYTIMYVCGWFAGGAPSTFKPWLAIPMEQYFRYDIFIVRLRNDRSWRTVLPGVEQR